MTELYSFNSIAQDDRKTVCVLGSRENISGFFLCGLCCNKKKEKNFFFTDGVRDCLVEEAFNDFFNRKETLIIFITEETAKRIKKTIEVVRDPVPSIVVIPENSSTPDFNYQ